MKEKWTPPSNCIFEGGVEEFLVLGSERLKRCGYRGALWGDFLELIPNDPPPGQPKTRAFVTGYAMPNNRCRIEFELERGDWSAVREQIDYLLNNLMADEWIRPPLLKQTQTEEKQASVSTLAPSSKGDRLRPEDWADIFEPIARNAHVDPNYKAIAYLLGRKPTYVKKKWLEYCQNNNIRR